jgi:hypothetical protein
MLLTYRSLDDAYKANLPQRIKKVICTCIKNLVDAYGTEYDPDDDGYVVLYSQDTTAQDAIELFGRTWTDACLEGVLFDKDSDCFLTCVLCNNQFGYTIIVPDAEWLDPAFRAKLLAELVD